MKMNWVNCLIISSIFVFTITVTLGFLGFSKVLTYCIRDQTALRRRNLVRKFYLKLPISLEFGVYFFNVTNPREVDSGRIPVLEEIGPYIYDAYKEKVDVIDDDGEDSLSYIPHELYFFNEELSGNLTQNDYVTILNPLTVGIANTVSNNPKQAPLMPIVSKAINLLFDNPKSIYLSVKVRDILFDGVAINCTPKDYPVRALCPQLKTQLEKFIVESEKNVYRFSFLGMKNGTIPNRFKVLRGIKEPKNLGSVIEYDGQRHINTWGSKECDKFHGTDGWIIPPLLPKEDGIWVFTSDLCRNIHAIFVEDSESKGISLRKYYATLGDASSVLADKCYCPTPKTCPPKGVMDLTKCLGVPIYASLPHFAAGDRKFLKQVKGLEPDMEKHAVRIMLEYMTGTPLEAQKRMQFNLPIKPTNKLEFMRSIPEAMHPILWIEEAIYLKGSLLNLILNIFLLLKIVNIVKYFFLIVSALGLILGGYLRFRKNQKAVITPQQKKVRTIEIADENDIILRSGTNSSESSEGKHVSYVKHGLTGHEFDRYSFK